jgi:hypothetical protein
MITSFYRGTSLLNKVVKDFEKATANLEKAAQQIEAKRQRAVDQMNKLHLQEAELYNARNRARTVSANISKLIEA